MTGYGSATMSSENYKVTVELKSLNSKFLEVVMKLPRSYVQHEIELRNFLTLQLKRGKVAAMLNVEVMNPEKHRLRINKALAKAYSAELGALQAELGLEDPPTLQFLLTLPDVVSDEDNEGDPEEWDLIEVAFQKAAERLMESREREGKALERDLGIRVDLIKRRLETVEKLIPNRTENVRTRVMAALNEAKDRIQVDDNRFEQELLYYIEKLDVNEEVVRLRKHIEYFEQTLNEQISNGKRLSFISQEMGREINTIGSKANDAEVQAYVVQMKEELEKIKEQLANVV